MTWPAVFDGIGALFVRCDNDPDVQAARIPGLTWCAVKVNGDDASPPAEREPWRHRMAARGVQVGCWIDCFGPPPGDVADVIGWGVPIVYDVEARYKSDESGGHYEWAAELVAEHRRRIDPGAAVAVTSYGGYKTSIDFAAFAAAGWPILAQGYDSFTPSDAVTYYNPGPYPVAGVHNLVRSLHLTAGQAVYRPESIDS